MATQTYMMKTAVAAHPLSKKSTTRFMKIGSSPFQIYQRVAERLHYHKVCARWVPNMPTDKQTMTSALRFFQRYNNEGVKFVDHVVTGDETRISFSNVETKKIIHSAEPQWSANTKKIQTNLSCRKLMATVLRDRRGVLLVAFMNPRAKTTSEVCCEMLKQLTRAVQNRQSDLLTLGVVLLQ
jgi:Transposase.